MTNYIFAGLILTVWFLLTTGMSWDKDLNPTHNIFLSLEVFIMVGLVYWVPFWLIFLRQE